jgi:two-component system response regulator NreC
VEQGITYRLLIADNQLLYRRGLRTILEAQPDLHVAAEASSLQEAIEKANSQTLDLILMNAALVEAAGAERPAVDIPTLLLGSEGPDAIARTAHASEIIAAIRSHAKRIRRNQELVSRDMEEATAVTAQAGTFPGLTIRESEILRLLVENFTAREVANELGLSIKTVEAHKLNVMRKLGVHNRASLIRFAAEHGVTSAVA